MKMHEESTQSTEANRHPWNKADFSNRIQQITHQLQDIRGNVSKVLKLYGSDSVASPNHYRSITTDPRPTTSRLNQPKVYGRDAEKGSILERIVADNCEDVIVLPIVGVGGMGKTALAQLVYNDPSVKSQFERIWVWVSENFDEVRITREMLNFLSQERHEGISSFDKLQDILSGCVEFLSKRFLLILDDVWDNMDDYRRNRLLAPLKSSQVKGNVILVTTRNLSVAQRIGTIKLINLDALANEDFWLLFKACAFGHENYEVHESLDSIGQKIAVTLKGNPLAAETAGALLREHLTVDHWSTIMENEDWKSLQLSRGIMPALKRSYDQLPYHLQQCFSYCSIFPDNYRFPGEELVRIWISQGFVKYNHSSKRLEEVGRYYLTDLVNLGFFQQYEREGSSDSFPGSQTRYAICGLMHDFARVVSRTECSTIDGKQCNEMLPTVRHLSIVTDSAYKKDLHGNIPRNEKFEEKMRNTVTSVRQLRTLVLIGQYESFFFQSLQDIFRKAHNLRLLQMTATSAAFNSLVCSLVNPTHLRYLKLEPYEEDGDGALPQDLGKFYHLQPNGMNNLVSLRHLVAEEVVYSSHDDTSSEDEYDSDLEEDFEPQNNQMHIRISGYNGDTFPTWLGTSNSVVSLQTLHIEGCGKWRRLPPLEGLPFLAKFELRNMQNITEVSIPSLEYLVLINIPKLKKCSCISMRDLNSSLRVLKIKQCPALKIFPLFESSQKFKIQQKSWLPSLWKLIIHKCPHLLVPHPLPPSTAVCALYITRVSTLPTIKGSSSDTLTIGLTSEDDYHFFDPYSDKMTILDDKILAYHNLSGLRELCINSCRNLTYISLKGLRQLASLKCLDIRNCPELFSSDVMPEQTHEDLTAADGNIALPSLTSLRITFCEISGKWLSVMLQHAPAIEELCLSYCWLGEEENFPLITALEGSSSGYPDESPTSSARDGPLHLPLNLISSVKKIAIRRCPRLTFFGSKKGLAGLTSLEELTIEGCPGLLSSLVEKDRNDGLANGRWILPQSLGQLEIHYCSQVTNIDDCSQETLHPCFLGNSTRLRKLKVWRSPSLESMQLRSCTALEELIIQDCESLAALEGLQSLGSLRYLRVHFCPSLKSMQLRSCTALEELDIWYCKSLVTLEGLQSPEASSSGYPEEGPLHLPLNLISSVKNIAIRSCPSLTFFGSKEGLAGLTSLEKLKILECPGLLSSLVNKDGNDGQANGRLLLPQSLGQLEINEYSQETLHPCFLGNPTRLRKLNVSSSPSLKSMQLRSCTALEELDILYCESLVTQEGLQSLGSLRDLTVLVCSPGLAPCLERPSGQCQELCPRLERLRIDDPSVLTTSFCKHLTSLQRLQLDWSKSEATRLTDEQERALLLLKSLQELKFSDCCNLVDFPAELHSFPSLKRLEIWGSFSISRLPEKGLPPSLEKLVINFCSEELTDQCRKLATSKLKVEVIL